MPIPALSTTWLRNLAEGAARNLASMSVLPLGPAARLLFTGAPALYGAARAVGCDRRQALAVLTDSATVLVRSARHSPADWREQNAVRHFTWQAWLTARHGIEVSRAVASAQERGREGSADSAVDVRNNAAGQEHGLTQAEHLIALGRHAAVTELMTSATHLFRTGALAAEPRRRRRRRRPRRPPG